MAEALVVAGFLVLLIFFQYREQKNIKLVAKNSWLKKGLAVVLAALLLSFFWSNNLADQIKLTAFAGLILVFGFMKEGFGEDHLIKLGVLAGDLHTFKKIQIEPLANQRQFVSFYNNKNHRLSLIFDMPEEELIAYFEKNSLQDRLVIGEDRQLQEKTLFKSKIK